MPINLSRINNIGFSGNGDETLFLSMPINYITVVASFKGLLLSVDKGQTFISVPVGRHSFRVGITHQIRIQSEQPWQITAERE